jgi:hypothetical protein
MYNDIAFVYLHVSWFHSQRYGLAAPSAGLSRATLLALLADLVWYVFVGFRLGRGCWVGVPILHLACCFRCCCALTLKVRARLESFLSASLLKGV